MARGAVFFSVAFALLLSAGAVVGSAPVVETNVQHVEGAATAERNMEAAEQKQASPGAAAEEDVQKQGRSVVVRKMAGLNKTSLGLFGGAVLTGVASALLGYGVRKTGKEPVPVRLLGTGMDIVTLSLLAASIYHTFKRIPVKQRQQNSNTEIVEAKKEPRTRQDAASPGQEPEPAAQELPGESDSATQGMQVVVGESQL